MNPATTTPHRRGNLRERLGLATPRPAEAAPPPAPPTPEWIRRQRIGQLPAKELVS